MPFFRFQKVLLAFVVSLFLSGPVFATPELLVDMRTGEVLYEKDAGQPWHPASLTKLMTAYLTFEAIAAGQLTLDSPVIVSANALKAPPSKIGAPVDTAFTVNDALYLLIVKSANDIAIALAETVGGTEANFVAEMNRTAAAMGLTATHFVNPHGLHDPAQVTSARDLAVLALTIRHRYPQYSPMFATESVRLGKAKLTSQNNLLTHFEGTTGMKTGYVCASGLNIVATVERQGRQLMAVVLGGSSGRERGEMTAKLFLQGFSGALPGTGKVVTGLQNVSAQPTDMRPFICGKEAGNYVAARKEAFPMGLEGQPSYLNDLVQSATYQVSALGRLRDVPMPRPRPLWAPEPRQIEAAVIPLPRPDRRVELRAGL